MANTDYSVSRDELFTDVLSLLGVLEEGESPSTNQTTILARHLNALLKHLQAEGLNVYALRETFLFLMSGKERYDQLDYNGTTGLDVDRDHVYVSDYERVTFTDISTAATTVEVAESFLSGDPVASAVVGDVIGIPLEDGTIHWAEIDAVGTSGSFSKSFDFTGHALPSDADATKKMVVGVSYPGRPIKISSCSLREFHTNLERPITVTSVNKYSELNSKQTSGTVNQAMYNRRIESGDLRVWPVPTDDNYCLVLWAQVPMSDIESDASLNTDTGIPQEFILFLTYALAQAVMPMFSPPTDVRNDIHSLAAMYKDEVYGFDTEDSMFLMPDYWN